MKRDEFTEWVTAWIAALGILGFVYVIIDALSKGGE